MPLNKPIVRIALSGDSGRMGKSLQKLIKKTSFMRVADKANHSRLPDKWKVEDIDGIIDFSLPDLFVQSIKWAVANKKAFVSGTTGFTPSHKKILWKASKIIPVFYGANMSGGIFLLNEWLRTLWHTPATKVLIEDIHHKDKKDRPSGTALSLKSHLPVALQKRLQIKSFRQGKVFGTHRVVMKHQEEILTLEHRALNREVFSRGALQALLFILKKKKGLYGPRHLYNQQKLPLIF